MQSLCDAAVEVLTAASPVDKVRLTFQASRHWNDGTIAEVGNTHPPVRPARPGHPEILPPNKMPRRGTSGVIGKIAMIHALAHIEFNAIDLAWDIIARFADQDLPKGFYDDWVKVAHQEAEHFMALDKILRDLGAHYGSLPAHDGLWQAAVQTSHDLLSRLAVMPMTLEARALDTAPTTINKLDAASEWPMIQTLSRIVDEEIEHVAAGARWFKFVCKRGDKDPATVYHEIIRHHFPGGLKRPFNYEARTKAGLPQQFYEPLAAEGK
jgi:uncharacterized ferritin-like protein (DUF455 family)